MAGTLGTPPAGQGTLFGGWRTMGWAFSLLAPRVMSGGRLRVEFSFGSTAGARGVLFLVEECVCVRALIVGLTLVIGTE